MTITINPQTKALADPLLRDIPEEDARDFEESWAAIARALAGDPAEDISYEEYRAQFEEERKTRRRKHDAQRDKVAA